MPEMMAMAPPMRIPKKKIKMKKITLVSGDITIRHTCIIVAKNIDNTARGVLLL